MHTLITGDAVASLLTLQDESAHCCVTSPPYYGLRDYGISGQIGAERTPDEYVEKVVGVFREVWRVLRNDGTLWLNVGDSYNSSTHWTGGGPNAGAGNTANVTTSDRRGILKGLKAKNLIGIPWRVAFALQADGWLLRQDVVWNKPNAMPESVKDRCTRSHEYLFMFAKSSRYYYDHEAVMEPAVSDHASGNGYKRDARLSYKNVDGSVRGNDSQWNGVGGMRNRRSVWTICTRPYKGAHFAVFPEELVRPCILAGCPAGGAVLDPFCGSGTTAAVACQEGRRSISVEISPEYTALYEKRMAQALNHVFLKHRPSAAA